MHTPDFHWNPRYGYYMHMTGFTRLSLSLVLQATKVSGQIKAWVKGYMRYTKYLKEPGNKATLLAALTRFNRVVFDSFLHLHFVAMGDGSALEEGKTRKLTIILLYIVVQPLIDAQSFYDWGLGIRSYFTESLRDNFVDSNFLSIQFPWY